jgi:hypothetical protein
MTFGMSLVICKFDLDKFQPLESTFSFAFFYSDTSRCVFLYH